MQHYRSLEQISTHYQHVYLSPHLDDAILSCGGAIASHVASGSRVLVITICTAVPTRDQLGPLAEEFHGDWNLKHEEAVTARLQEDVLAMERVGADYFWVGALDAIYRKPFQYDTRENLFGTPLSDDPLYGELTRLLPEVQRQLAGATFYAPLGVGLHVDHQITFEVASQVFSGNLAFYEDVYYALLPGEVEKRLSMLPGHYIASTVDISNQLQRKIGAIDAYASQVPELFGGSEAMATAISVYAEQLRPAERTYGERIWLPAPATLVS
jgi:LmbE family N-acetylglucosaminyl deacetylase